MMVAGYLRAGCCLALIMGIGGCAATGFKDGARHHAYAFDEPELLATQRVFGVGNGVTLLGEACADDPKATASYEQWRATNGDTLRAMTGRLAVYYRIQALPNEQQTRVAEVMHLKTRLMLSDSALQEACASLPETLVLPWMNLAKRYQATLAEVQDPNYLKPKNPKKTKKTDDREEQTRSE